MLGARRGVHTGYVAPSERSGALLIGQERLADLAAWLLTDDERPSDRSAWLLIDDERLSERSAWLLINAERLSDLAAWLQIDTESPPESSEGLSINLGQRVVRRRRPLLHHVERLARLGLHAVRRRELERLEQREPSCLHEWPSRDKRRQSQVLAREPAVGRVLLLAGLMHPVDSLDQHLVLRLKVPQSVANLLRHAVVVRVLASRW